MFVYDKQKELTKVEMNTVQQYYYEQLKAIIEEECNVTLKWQKDSWMRSVIPGIEGKLQNDDEYKHSVIKVTWESDFGVCLLVEVCPQNGGDVKVDIPQRAYERIYELCMLDEAKREKTYYQQRAWKIKQDTVFAEHPLLDYRREELGVENIQIKQDIRNIASELIGDYRARAQKAIANKPYNSNETVDMLVAEMIKQTRAGNYNL